MLQIKTKYIKETEKEHAHTEIYLECDGKDEIYLGYYMKEDPRVDSYNPHIFVSHSKLPYFRAATKTELFETLELLINKKPVTLKQHFGMILNIEPEDYGKTIEICTN